MALVHLVAVVDGEVVGRSNVARPPMLPDGTVALNVGVTASARRRGVGAALFDRTAENVPSGTGRLLAFTDDRDDDVVMAWLATRHSDRSSTRSTAERWTCAPGLPCRTRQIART